MAKISTNVSDGLAGAIATAMSNIDSNAAKDLLNSGAEKRKRKTKTEPVDDSNNSLFESMGITDKPIDNRPEWDKRNAKDHDEFCEWELEKAKLKNLPEPDFDFRHFYEVGDTIYYVRVFKELGDKEIFQLKIRTIYPRMIVGVVESGYCECLGYLERDQIFQRRVDAQTYFNSAQVNAKEGVEFDEETGKKKRTKIVEEEQTDGEEMSSEQSDSSVS